MQASFCVHFTAMKGLGPEWVPEVIHVFLDDLDPDMSESEIYIMALQEADTAMRARGFTRFRQTDINNC